MSGPCATRQPMDSSQARAACSTTDSVKAPNVQARLRQMNDVHVTPTLLEVLRHESAVTVMGLVFAAKQATISNHLLRDLLFAPALAQKSGELPLVIHPAAPSLLVPAHLLLRGPQGRH